MGETMRLLGHHVLQIYTGHSGTPILNELMIFAAEYLVYLIPLTLLYFWFVPEKERTDAGFRMVFSIPRFATEEGKSKSVFVFIAIVVSLAISYAMSQFYSHPAPYMVGYETLLTETPENSFPSQHTTVVFAFAWSVSYLQDRWQDGLVALALASFVGISRVYVGVHYPIDIVGAVGASLIGFILVYAARKYVMKFANRCIRIENRLKSLLFRTL
jgi:undecaprenyl-diphosphatase